jgi:hypothetical protein
MPSFLKSLCVGLALAVFAAGSVAASGAFPPKTVSAGGVVVTVKPLQPSASHWDFDIALNTHTQELSDNLVQSASLVIGVKTIGAVSWLGDPPGGHHRKGVLRFNAVEPQAREFELRIMRPGESAARVFRWH